MSVIVVDCETYCELEVKHVGQDVYAQHPSTEVLMWIIRAGDWKESRVYQERDLWKILARLRRAGELTWSASDPLTVIHWTAFDRSIATHQCAPGTWVEDQENGFWRGPLNTRWIDLSEISLQLGTSGMLKWAAKFWAEEEPKGAGTALINRFCKPNKMGVRNLPQSAPEKWAEFVAYGAQDGQSTWATLAAIEEAVGVVGEDLNAHHVARGAVQRMNDRGVYVDLPAVERARNAILRTGQKIRARVEKKYGINLLSQPQMKEALGTPNVKRETIEELLESGDLTPEGEELAEARLIVAGAANKKLDAMRDRVGKDRRVRGCFVYHGAWTRRMSSKGVQFQNFVRMPSDPQFFRDLELGKFDNDPGIFQAVRNNIRGFVRAAPGMMLVASDYSQIELRVAAWLPNESWLVKALRSGQDVYRLVGGKILGIEPADLTGEQRQIFKTVELASQFGLSGNGINDTGGLYQRLWDAGIRNVPRRECARIIDMYREEHPAIVQMWRDCQTAVESLVHADPGWSREVCGIVFERTEYAISVRRPSGFKQYMWFPQFVNDTWPDGGPRRSVKFMGRNKAGAMSMQSTYGGRIFQGIVQGIAADIMYEGMAAAEAGGFPPIMAVHDEIVTEVKKVKRDRVEELSALLCQPISWAKGLPLKAEGWQGERFTK